MFNEVKTLISYDLMKKMHDGLYDYQRECCDTAIKKLKEPGESFKGQIILPTGSGKTKIAEYLTAEVLNLYFGMEHRYANFAVACHRLILADNLLNRILDTMINEFNYKNFKIVVVNSGEYDEFANDFAKHFENETTKTVLVNFKDISQNIEAYVENENRNGNHVFFVVLYQSMEKLLNTNLKIDFAFFDEAHITVEQQHYKVLEQLIKNEYFRICFYMTATRVVKQNGCGMDNKEIYGDIIYKKRPIELVRTKHIVPCKMILMDMFNTKTHEFIQSNLDNLMKPDEVVNAVRICAESLFKRVEEDQERAKVPMNVRNGGILFVTVAGNRYMEAFRDPKTVTAKKFKAWTKENNIDIYLTSAKMNGNIDYPETEEYDYYNINKNKFVKKLNEIGNVRKNKTIIINIDQLSEGIDLPNINGVLIMRQCDDNIAKILQIVGRAVRRDSYDRPLINDNTVKYDDWDKFMKPCAYVYIPSIAHNNDDINFFKKILTDMYEEYGDDVLMLAERFNGVGSSEKMFENIDGLVNIPNTNEVINSKVGRAGIETVLNLIIADNLMDMQIKRKYIYKLICVEHTRNSVLSGRDEKDYTADHNKFVKLLKKFEHNYHMDINTLFDYFVKNQTFKEFDIDIPEFNF